MSKYILQIVFFAFILTVSFMNCSQMNFDKKEEAQVISTASTQPQTRTVCNFNGQVFEVGQSTRAFRSPTVASNSSCESETRVCLADGRMSGNFGFSTCSVESAPPTPTNKLECVRRSASSEEPPAMLTSLQQGGGVTLKQDIYRRYTDGTYHLVQKCNDWHSSKENGALNCGAEISGTFGINAGQIINPVICCPIGRVSINGSCETENGEGEYCFASSQCHAGLTCSANHICVPK